MLKEFIQHIQETTINRVVRDDDNHTAYLIGNDGTYTQIKPELEYAKPLDVYSLDALVKMIKRDEVPHSTLFVQIPDVDTVIVFTTPAPNLRYMRPGLYKAHAIDVPGWDSDKSMDFESMQIALRTRFQDSPDILYLQKLLSDITSGSNITYNDNGVASTIVTQKGVALQSKEAIRPIVNLRPYRTFQEVDQPESPFLIRVSERGIRLVAADGGMWKLQARKTIKSYLEEALKEEIDNGGVVVAL